MLEIRYTHVCDYCGKQSHRGWTFPPFESAGPVPLRPDGWQVVDGNLVCDEHQVTVGQKQPTQGAVALFNPAHQCPYCSSKVVSRCRCPKSDTLCENGHEWHFGKDERGRAAIHAGSGHGNNCGHCDVIAVLTDGGLWALQPGVRTQEGPQGA